ncbi:MAG: nicotinamide mononucleotide transporter [Erysipelotrichaceae bacterium]|nr:nicotinamide mononucleotide transporter [Erysipelotrichaceae bacterium]
MNKKISILYIVILFLLTLITITLNLNWLDYTSVILEITCILLLTKRNFFSIIIKLISDLFYVYIAYKTKYYGDASFYLFISTPITIISYFSWNKNLDETKLVKSRSLTIKTKYLLCSLTLIITIFYAYLLKTLGGINTILDAGSTVSSLFAYIFMMLRYQEQWIMWILQYLITIFMYVAVGNFLITFMSTFCLLSSIIGYKNWREKNQIFHAKK